MVAAHLGENLLIVLPDEYDDRVHVIDSGLEARVWKEKKDYFVYEIASMKSGVVLARGEASSAYAAIERSIPLLLLLHERSDEAMRHAA